MAEHHIAKRRSRVVIVDDSRTMQALLDQILSVRMGFEIVGIAGDADSALSMIQQLRPDLVTVDLHMPYIDGRSLLKSLAQLPDVRKVVLSAHVASNLAMKASLEALGADACIDKAEMSRDPEGFGRQLVAVLRKSKPAIASPEAPKPDAGGATIATIATARFPIPADEQRRLALLDTLKIANDDGDHLLDLLTCHLEQTTSFSACAITIIDHDTQWMKSARGIDRQPTSRAQAFCAYTICDDEPFVVQDARADWRLRQYEAVVSGPMIRAYAGLPIISSSGIRLGAVCLIDTKPKKVTEGELRNLQSMARIASAVLEGRPVHARQAA